MQEEQLFSIVNATAILGWILLIIFPRWKYGDLIVTSVIIALLSVVYLGLILSAMQATDFKNFRSLKGVMALFEKPLLALAGWVHYLAFDLLAGLFIKNNAARHGIVHGLIVPCLLLTFLLGPVGLLLYLLIRWLKTKNYSAQNF